MQTVVTKPVKLRISACRLGFVGRVRHPVNQAQRRRVVGHETEAPVSVTPPLRMRIAPGSLLVQASHVPGNDSLFPLLLMPDRPTRFDHHFVRTALPN